MGRAPCCDKANVKKGPWSPDEDAKLKSYIDTYGTGGNWIALPQKIGLKRCGKSCRLRWLNYLRPNIKHGGFTEDEDNLICSLYISIGSRWSIIAAQLPGRTDNDIKNYWNTRLKKKLLGKQRREQQLGARRGGTKPSETKKGFDRQTYSINDYRNCFGGSLYPKPPQPVYASQLEMHQLHQPGSNYSLANHVLLVSQTEANFHRVHNYDVSCGDHHHQRYSNCETNPMFESDLRCCVNYGVDVNFPAFGVNGVNSFSAVEMTGCGTVSSASPENSNWGDVNANVYPSALDNSEDCREKMIPDWTLLFDEPRLLGYTQ